MLFWKETMLLCSKEKSGELKWMIDKRFIKLVLSAAVLQELMLLKKITIGENINDFEIVDNSLPGNPILDNALYLLSSEHKKINKYIRKLAKTQGNLEEQMWGELRADGIVKYVGKERILTKPEVRDELIKNIQETVANKKEPDDKMRALLGFLKVGVGLRKFFKNIGIDKSIIDKKWIKKQLKFHVPSDDESEINEKWVRKQLESRVIPFHLTYEITRLMGRMGPIIP